MKKKFQKRTLLIAALTMSTIALGNFAKADLPYLITNETELHTFLEQTGEATGKPVGNIQNDFSVSANIGAVTSSSALTLNGGGYIIDGQSTNSGFTVGNDKSLSIDNLTMQNFKNIDSSNDVYGSVIYNKAYSNTTAKTSPVTATISLINSKFESNQVQSDTNSAKGGAIYNFANSYYENSNDATAKITDIQADFKNNSAVGTSAKGGAIANERGLAWGTAAATIDNITGTFDGNYAKSTGSSGYTEGGAIYNAYGTVTISDSTFKNNYAEATNIDKADGGAICNSGTDVTHAVLNLTGTNIFENNYVTDGTQKTYNDIYNSDILNISGNISMTGGIAGSGTTNIASGTVVKLGPDATLSQYTLNINDATIDLQNGAIDTFSMRHPNTDSVVTFKLDYDGTKSWAQYGGGNIDYIDFKGNTSGISNVNVKVSAINVIADGITDTSAKWFDGGTGVTISTPQTIKAATQNYIYTFTKNSNGKSFNIEAKDIGNLTLGEIVHESDYSFLSSYSLSDNYNFKEDEYLGDLAGADREFTIFGNGYTIDATPNDSDITAITISSGQTFNLDTVTMKGFKTNFYTPGGVINNKGTIDSLTANFTDNKASDHLYNSFVASGGVIYNSADADKTAKIKNITGTFADNRADAFSEVEGSPNVTTKAQGGAIANIAKAANSTAEIDDINTDFTTNYAKATVTNDGGFPITSIAQGGAIYNYQEGTATALIKNITGTFSGNYANATATATADDATATAQGGAIYNEGATINSITGGFTGNYVMAATTSELGNAKSTAQGGAIYNNKTIDLITADFTSNYVTAIANTDNMAETYAQGGAIYNGTGATIKDMNGTFEGNYTKTMINSDPSSGFPQGGAIYNLGTIGDTTDQTKGGIGTSDKYAVFKYNGIEFVPVPGSDEVTPELRTQKGGAITNIGTINNVYADFTQNAVTEEGGAIWNASGAKIKAITGVFNGNIADGKGGAIYNNGGTIGYDTDKGGIGTSDKYAVFSGNGVDPENTVRTKNGGAIYNTGTITNIYADFTQNAVTNGGGAIWNDPGATITAITGTFNGNIANEYGGAIYNTGTITNINANFESNVAKKGGAIYNKGTATISNIVGTYTNNESNYGGAIYNEAISGATAKITKIDANFIGNIGNSQGGAIFNRANYKGASVSTSTISEITGEFKENTSQQGGAIYNEGTLENAIAKIELIDKAIFKDNYATQYGGAIYNHQYKATAEITLKDVIFENNYVINGTQKTYNDIHNPTGTINITGNVSMTGGITNHDVETPAGTTNITSTGTLTLLHAIDEQGTDKGLATLKQGTVKINGGTLSIQNGVGGDVLTIENLDVETGKTANFKIDCDPANTKFDIIYISNDGTGKGSIALTDIKMLSDISDGTSASLYWAYNDNSLNWNDATGTIYSASKDYFYTFTYDEPGAVKIDTSTGKELISDFDLPTVVGAVDPNQKYEKIWYYKLADNITLVGKSLGSLGGTGRKLTIDGQGHTLDGNGNQGIEVANGQTFSLENITMKNFNKQVTTLDDGGGAVIVNNGTIKNINADFTKNSTSGTVVKGSVIYNKGTIGYFEDEVAKGGIGNATQKALFKENTATTDPYNILGGVINNRGTITNISADFISNKSISKQCIDGGVIYNFMGKITNIGLADNKAIFTTNIAQANGNLDGGIINNSGTIENINADFTENSITGTNVSGGVIYNDSKITNISGSFANNSVKPTSAEAYGGAILNDNTISNINADFTGNNITGGTDTIAGGAISNYDKITNISGSFANNSVSSESAEAHGGAIYNGGFGEITNISGSFANNSAKSTSAEAHGGAIYNGGIISNISGTFTNNTANAGGAIYNDDGTVKITNSTFEGNKATSTQGGAIVVNNGTVNVSNSYFMQNEAATYGGAIDVRDGKTLIVNNSTFDGNKAATSNGGAINSNGIIEVSNSTFTNNVSTQANGGAIMIFAGSATISDSTFSGNTANGKQNDIHNRAMLTFKGTNSLEGGISDDASPTGTTNIGDGKVPTTVTLGNNATLQQKEVVLNHNATLALGSRAAAEFLTNVNTFTVNGCALSLQNSTVDSLGFNNLVLNDDLTMMVDADLAKGRMDTIEAENVSGSGKIHVSNIKLISYSDDNDKQSLTFTNSLKDRVDYTGSSEIAYSPIYKYNVSYNAKNGMFDFSRVGGSGADAFVPAILASSAAVQAGGYITQVNSYDQAFSNMDQLMLMPRKLRTAWKNANKYAVNGEGTGDGIITYTPNQDISGRGVWFRPFASFENVPLNNGPKVDNFSYGGLVGGDSDLISLKHGWDMVWGAYAGYNGSHQKFQGNSIYQNGGMLGVNSVWYKGDFFTGLTLNVGASVADISTLFGKEYMTMLSTGIASKTGYNWELFDSKFIIQPSFLMSYSFINTFDYKNAAGVNMHADPLNAIQLVPGLKFIGNLPKGWQPYIGVSMIWNLMDKTKFYANDVSLPQMSIDPYVQYGLGVQKRWGDKFTGFGQVMFRNGGRNGIALDAGFKYELGKNGLNTDKKAAIKHYTERNVSLTAK